VRFLDDDTVGIYLNGGSIYRSGGAANTGINSAGVAHGCTIAGKDHSTFASVTPEAETNKGDQFD